jgi:hypothetical protein
VERSLETNDELMGYSSPEEELEKLVTLQIALIATDGWILASDTRAHQLLTIDLPGSRSVVPVMTDTSKIVNCDEVELIYSYAGGALAQRAGLLLRSMAETDDRAVSQREAFLRNVAEMTMKEAAEQSARNFALKGPQPTVNGTLIVIFRRPTEIWTLDIAHVQAKREMAWGWGGGGNMALIFTQQFYQPRSIEALKLLAAHTILTGGKCNPGTVEGLELWWGDSERSVPADSTEIAKLKAASSELESLLGKLLVR